MTTPFVVGPLIEKYNQIFIYMEFFYLTILLILSMVTLSLVRSFSFQSVGSRNSKYSLNNSTICQNVDSSGVELKTYSNTDNHRLS